MSSYLQHLLLLLKKLGIAFLIFSICRILFYVFNSYHFSEVSFGLFYYGLRFDMVAISFLFAPLIILQLIPFSFRNFSWYHKLLAISFYSANSLAIALNLIDVAYFDFTLKRTTADFFEMVTTGHDFFNLLPHYIIDFWYNYLLFAILLILSWFLHKKYCKSLVNFFPYLKKDYFIHSLILVLFSGFTLIGMRGGIQYRPIDIVNAGEYAESQNLPIVLNTPFTILKTALIDNINTIDYFNENEIESVFNPIKKIGNGGSSRGKNIVLIILESFAKEYVGGFNNGVGYTPFLDTLLKKSYVFNNAYSNGQRSIEALPSIFSGIPHLMNSPYIVSNYSGNKLNSLPSILNQEGYNTSFYHSGENGTMGFSAFASIAGIENYYGLDEYPKKEEDFDGVWGIFDEPYLQYYANELNKKPEPFFSTIFTVSSHHPYTIPEKHKDKFPKGTLPLHETIGYTDFALQKFFKTSEKMDWFNNTIFVFIADHSAQSNNNNYKTRLGRFAIPVFIYAPSTYLKGMSNNYFQHTDITPTLLWLTGIDKPIVTFGNNAFNKDDKFSVNYVNKSYQIAYKNSFLIFDGKETIEFYDLNLDSLISDNLIGNLNPQQKINKIEAEMLLKGIIQQYNNRMINNKLFVQ